MRGERELGSIAAVLGLAVLSSPGAAGETRISELRIADFSVEGKFADPARNETVFVFRVEIANALPIAANEIRIKIAFESVTGTAPYARHTFEHLLGPVAAGRTEAFEFEHRTELTAYESKEIYRELGIVAFEFELADPVDSLLLVGSLGEERPRAALGRALAGFAADESRGESLAGALERANLAAPADGGLRHWLARFRDQAAKDDPARSATDLLVGHVLEGDLAISFRAVFESLLVRTLLVRALVLRPVAGGARAVLEFAAAFEGVPPECEAFFRALGEAGYPALADAYFVPGLSRVARDLIWKTGHEGPADLVFASNPVVARAVARSFGESRYVDALGGLARVGTESDSETAMIALEAAVSMGDVAADTLVLFADSRHPEVRARAASALASLGDSRDLAALDSRRRERIAARLEEGRRCRDLAGDLAGALAAIQSIESIDTGYREHLGLVGEIAGELEELGVEDPRRSIELVTLAWRHRPDRSGLKARILGAYEAWFIQRASAEDTPIAADHVEREFADLFGEPDGRIALAGALDLAAKSCEETERLREARLLLEEALARRSDPDLEERLGRALVQLGLDLERSESQGTENEPFERVLALSWAAEARRAIARHYIGIAHRLVEARDWSGARSMAAQAARFDAALAESSGVERQILWARWWIAVAALALSVASWIVLRFVHRTRPNGSPAIEFAGRPRCSPVLMTAGLATLAASFTAQGAAQGDLGGWALAAAAVALAIHIRAAHRHEEARSRRIRLTPDSLEVSVGTDSLSIAWSRVRAISTEVATELAVLLAPDGGVPECPHRIRGPLERTARVEGGVLWIRGRYDRPFTSIGEAVREHAAAALYPGGDS